MPSKPIKVASIITPLQVVLNCGLSDNVKLGDLFVVYAVGDMVKDPETQENLEELEIVRGKGKVVHIQDKICTIESVLVSEHGRNIIRRPSSFLLGNLMGNIEETEILKDAKPFVDVHIGDRARKLR